MHKVKKTTQDMTTRSDNSVLVEDLSLDALSNAALWVRQKYKIPVDCTIDKEFEKEFNCEILIDERGFSRDIVFNSEADHLLFLLKWSR